MAIATKKYSERVQVVFKPEDAEHIKQLADNAGMSLSGFCKQLILDAIHPKVDTTALLPIDSTLPEVVDTTVDTTYVTTEDAKAEYERLWDAIETAKQMISEIATTQVTTHESEIATTCSYEVDTTEPSKIDTTYNSNDATTYFEPVEVVEPVATTLDTTHMETPYTLTIQQLAARLETDDLPQGVLTDKLILSSGKKHTVSSDVLGFIRQLDPDGYAWLPTDRTKQVWTRSKS